jgi:hypothetical protein
MPRKRESAISLSAEKPKRRQRPGRPGCGGLLELPYPGLTALRQGPASLCASHFRPHEIEVMMTPLNPSSHARPLPVARRQAPLPTAGAKGLVAERIQARKRRIRVIRTRVVAIATAMFVASSGGILVQLVTGNDPALAKAAAAKVASTAGKSSSSGSTPSSSMSGSSTSGASSGSSNSGKTTAVTTSSS